MKKEIWLDGSKNPENLEKIVRKYDISGILGKDIDCQIYEIQSLKDIDNLPIQADYVFVDFKNWEIIPAENIIARYADSKTKIIVKTNDIGEMRRFANTLEKGVDGFLVDDADKINEMLAACNRDFYLGLVDAVVKKTKKIDRGLRACLDCIDSFKPREGSLVGLKTGFMFLVDAETSENPYVNTRVWRVNAGAASNYVLAKHNEVITPRYINDLKSGDEIVAVDANGASRIETVGRIKLEKRPMIFIEAEYNNKTGSICLQDAETIRVVTADGSKSMNELQEGDKIKAYVADSVATHFGSPVKETIDER